MSSCFGALDCCVQEGAKPVPSTSDGRGRVGPAAQRAKLTRSARRHVMRYNRISADCHIDLPWLPPDLFTGNASAALKDRMPYVTEGPDGTHWTSKNGKTFGLVNSVGPSGQKFTPGTNYRVDVMASTGLYDDGKK